MAESRECADIESSSDAYASRFAGPLGEWLLSVQEQGVATLVSSAQPLKVLDVGGGHGQLAPFFVGRGDDLTICGSDPVCEHRVRSYTESGACSFVSGDLMALPFEDNSFDLVISLRMMAHVKDWKRFLHELCRVSRFQVVVDYPSWRSSNILYSLLFPFKKGLEGNTRSFRIFWDSEIRANFLRSDACFDASFPQFFLPMVFHRALRSPRFSSALESFFRQVGLTGIVGSPTLASFKKVH